MKIYKNVKPDSTESLKYLLTLEMRDILADKGYGRYEEVQYRKIVAENLVRAGEILARQDTGFCQSYLVKFSEGIYFVSFNRILKFKEVKTVTQPVHVVAIDNKYGTQLTVFSSYDRAAQYVYAYVRENWSPEDGDIPEDREAAIVAYFSGGLKEEWYTIEAAQVDDAV